MVSHGVSCMLWWHLCVFVVSIVVIIFIVAFVFPLRWVLLLKQNYDKDIYRGFHFGSYLFFLGTGWFTRTLRIHKGYRFGIMFFYIGLLITCLCLDVRWMKKHKTFCYNPRQFKFYVTFLSAIIFCFVNIVCTLFLHRKMSQEIYPKIEKSFYFLTQLNCEDLDKHGGILCNTICSFPIMSKFSNKEYYCLIYNPNQKIIEIKMDILYKAMCGTKKEIKGIIKSTDTFFMCKFYPQCHVLRWMGLNNNQIINQNETKICSSYLNCSFTSIMCDDSIYTLVLSKKVKEIEIVSLEVLQAILQKYITIDSAKIIFSFIDTIYFDLALSASSWYSITNIYDIHTQSVYYNPTYLRCLDIHQTRLHYESTNLFLTNSTYQKNIDIVILGCENFLVYIGIVSYDKRKYNPHIRFFDSLQSCFFLVHCKKQQPKADITVISTEIGFSKYNEKKKLLEYKTDVKCDDHKNNETFGFDQSGCSLEFKYDTEFSLTVCDKAFVVNSNETPFLQHKNSLTNSEFKCVMCFHFLQRDFAERFTVTARTS